MTNSENQYRGVDELDGIIARFESCAFGAGEFKHREHLVVALRYLDGSNVEEAAERMRAGLYRFLDHHVHDRSKYHETITLFWIKKVQSIFSTTDANRPLAEVANEVVRKLGDADLIFDYYSRELLFSQEARQAWVEPDLKPL